MTCPGSTGLATAGTAAEPLWAAFDDLARYRQAAS